MNFFIKNLLLTSITAFLFLFIPSALEVYAVEVGLGAKVGYTFSKDRYYGIPSSGLTSRSTKSSSAISGNIFTDIRISDSFSIVPAVNMTINKGSDFDMVITENGKQVGDASMKIRFHTIDFEVLGKINYDYLFIAFGLAYSYVTKPSMKLTSGHEYQDLFDELQTTSSGSFYGVLDFGGRIPLGYYENHAIIINLRASANPFSTFFEGFFDDGSSASSNEKIRVKASWTAGVFVGYAYYFM